MDPIPIAKAIGLTVAGFSAGAQWATYFLAIPPMLHAPATTAVRQWSLLYARGRDTMPPLALAGTSAFTFLAYRVATPAAARLYGVAAISLFGFIPWTLLVIMPTNKKLLQKKEKVDNLGAKEELMEVGLPRGESSKELIQKWNTLHLGRVVFTLVSVSVGMWATFF